MKIGILGTGNMGRTLGSTWALLGHTVFFGSREPDKAQAVVEAIGQGTQGGSNDEAAAFGDVIFQTVRSLPTEFLSDPSVLMNKPLIDWHTGSTPSRTPLRWTTSIFLLLKDSLDSSLTQSRDGDHKFSTLSWC